MKQPPSSSQIILENIHQNKKNVENTGYKPHNEKTPLNQFLLITGNIVLIFTAVLCTFGAFLTSFSITVNMSVVVWLWLTSAVTLSIIVTLYRVKSLPAFIIPALFLFYVNSSEIIDGGMWVINNVTSSYGIWLPVTPLFPHAKNLVDEPTAFLAAAGIVIIILLSIAICLRRSLFSTILLTAPFVFLTFVITDMQPDVRYLFGLIAVYLSLLVSGAIAPDDYLKRGITTFPAFAIALVFMFFVFLLSPYGSYVRSNTIINLGNDFRAFSSQIGQFGQFWGRSNLGISWAGSIDGGMWHFNTNSVNIANSGSRIITHRSLLEISADRPGVFYLRGYSMGDFDGISWGRDPVDLRSFSTLDRDTMTWIDDSLSDTLARMMPAEIAFLYNVNNQDNDAPSLSNMSIKRTGDLTADITYQPYYIFMPSSNNDTLNMIERFFYIRSVHTLVDELINNGYYPGVDFGDLQYSERLHSLYTSVDESTAEGLRRLARENGIDPNAERYTVADNVARYIMSSATYTLSPEQVPDDVDFTLYFLEELKEGYCIHFASAAVLMLRSLDIPARFTTGYVANIRAGEVGIEITLTDENAHAWVEVFYENIGWLYLEVTPSAGNTYVPVPRPHTPQVINTPEPQEPVTPTPDPDEAQRPPEGVRPDDNTGIITTGPGQGARTVLNLPAWFFNLFIFIAFIAFIAGAFLVRRIIVKKIRLKRFEQANTNAAVICVWHYLKKMGPREAVAPKNIEDIALKARFSQHKMTLEERDEIVSYATRLAYEIYIGKESDFSRLWFKYIRALY